MPPSADVPGTAALVVGGGPERDSLETLARDLGMQARRDVFFTGVVPEHELLPTTPSATRTCTPDARRASVSP